MQQELLRRLMQVAIHERPARRVLKGGQVLNVFTGRLLDADVAIEEGIIAAVGPDYAGEEEIDCTGLTIIPGLIDAHLHIESAMVQPAELAKVLLPRGTTTLIADPHELANVSGEAAMDYLFGAAENCGLNVFVMAPSAVPASPFDQNGAGVIDASRLAAWKDRALGLGEVMCFPQVVASDPAALDKLDAYAGRPIDGHAPGLRGPALQAYRLAGIQTEHEASDFAEGLEKLEAGFALLVREGSAAHNLEPLVTGLLKNRIPTDRCAFCTDDKHLADIFNQGHIDHCVRRAIELGMPFAQAVRMATIQAARIYGLHDLGAVAPGYKADLVLLENAARMTIRAVYKDGVPAAERLADAQTFPVPDTLLRTVKLPELTEEDLALYCAAETDAIQPVPRQLLTRRVKAAVQRDEAGRFVPDGRYCKLCAVQRHSGEKRLAVAPLEGFGIRGGALATTVAHDSHNIVAAGDNDADLLAAMRALAEAGGGYAIARGGEVHILPLPVCGLVSLESGEAVAQRTDEMLAIAREMGIPAGVDPFITLSFLSLPVIPAIRLLDGGLFDAENFRWIEQ